MMEDLAVIIAVAVVAGLAIAYIVKAKKSGRKCIGCPDGGCCKKTECSCGCQDRK